ncbi:hypothetical protein MasN3_08700 [Massilia varians]|uniref:DUF3016 domain-containing protein n=1 Tax=Massilia varians TaxID=457921 RepID=A0ABM8C2G6_9BURK|nr:DUF3016 domain-containing protein [Massilia varians]BDT57376.1 hypothetical protein MasN3_08700 [Massilia varians]
MKTRVFKAALAAALALGAGVASAEVTVNYVNMEQFADLPSGEWERKDVLNRLADYIKKLGADLPAGTDLTVNIYNVDLAGREYPGQRASGDMRVLEGKSDWPLIELQYALSSNGQVFDSGTAQISDVIYMQRIMKRSQETDNLRYEKRMLQDWFKKTILTKKPG